MNNYLKVGFAVAGASFIAPRITNAVYHPIDVGDTGSTSGADSMQVVINTAMTAVVSAGLYWLLARV